MEKHTEILPFFPLTVFMFPGEDIPLRIFEPRYKQLIEDIRKTGGSFVIPFVIDQEMQEFGCEVTLKDVVAENPGGRMVITVESLSVVRILGFSKQLEGKLYAGGPVERIPCSEPVESPALRMLIMDYADDFDHDFLNGRRNAEFTRQDVIRALNLPSEEKFRFMSLDSGRQKEAYLSGQLHYLRMLRKQELLLDNDFGLN